MINHNSKSEDDQGNLKVLEEAAASPQDAYESDAEVRAAFDAELRNLAEEIVQFHPSLTQLLLSMGSDSEEQEESPVHGRN